jgi:hypothetical protein
MTKSKIKEVILTIEVKALYKPVLAFIVFLTFITIGRAQQPFQDARGEGTIFIDNATGTPIDGFVQINVADPSIRLGFLRDFSNEKYTFGVTLKGKLSGDRASLIGDNKLSPDAQFKFSIGKKYLFGAKEFKADDLIMTKGIRDELQRLFERKGLLGIGEKMPDPKNGETFFNYFTRITDPTVTPNAVLENKDIGSLFELREFRKYASFDRLVFQGGYSFSQYKLYDPTLAIDDQISKKNFHSPSAELIYFRQLNGRNLFGASIGIRRSNNSEDLTEIEVRDFTTTISGSSTREVGRTRKAMRGNFTQYTTSYINTDYVWFPKPFGSRIGLNLFTRSELSGAKRGLRPGVGLFISKENFPTKVIGGVSVSESGGKFNFALTAGFNF